MKLGWPLPKRKSLLQELLAIPDGKTYPQKFQGQIQDFKLLRVPLEMPKYRLANGRTQAAQEEYLSKEAHLPNDYFERDLESDEVQTIQHGLLKKMLGDLVTFFEKNIQEEPLILSHLGFVVNGNRRLCAMREICSNSEETNRELYNRFQYVNVIVLPPCDEKDIDELEAQLQIKKDIKADYSWVSEACMLRKKQRVYEYSYAVLAEMYGMREKDVEELLDKLEHVDLYLESRKKPKVYEEVEKAEYAFEQLRKFRAKFKDTMEKDIFTSLTYCIIDSPPSGRVYETIPQVAEHLPKIIERLQGELEVAATNEDDYEDIFGESLDDATLENFAITVSNPEKQDEIIEVIKDVIDEEKEREKDKKSKNYVLSKVQKANTSLSEAIVGFDKTTNTKGLSAQLDSIESAIRKLKEMF
ncbi:hypothetical protein IHV10_19975 [Fictibacillus sp. 5RED26]|uniref:hypothetical protein n=1 Tax=Fictibacillus sp. 5RED26 TaxID=2745876 RepID=UPI0018CE3AF4|nr:hypothetical protein [Fictibacillus sp. 5RED26]MBH0158664.1 hypothetical protein [Fictibacillus sp. 5RED26]